MRYADAVEALDGAAFEPGCPIDYDVVVEAISTLCRHGQRSRVIFVSDGSWMFWKPSPDYAASVSRGGASRSEPH
eukprot:2277859-Amphidinium_carterae.1